MNMNSDFTVLKKQTAKNLKDILETSEEWLMERVLHYAIQQGYSLYTSTLKEAWRLSISGLSISIINGIEWYAGEIPEITPEEDFTDDPVAAFGITEAKRHRKRGVSLSMFLGLMKYYRQSYIDLVRSRELQPDKKEAYELFINRTFDRIEIGFCVEWSELGADNTVHELQMNNLVMTNEKNKYLTIFESIPNPVILININQKIENMNFSAAKLFKDAVVPGSQYYCISKFSESMAEQGSYNCEYTLEDFYIKEEPIGKLLPWIQSEVEQFQKDLTDQMSFEKQIYHNNKKLVFQIKLAKILDVSAKFRGMILILENTTELKTALEDIKILKGIIPICMYCKNIRDDAGFWQKVEHYITEHSEALFSHAICPTCLKKHHPEFLW